MRPEAHSVQANAATLAEEKQRAEDGLAALHAELERLAGRKAELLAQQDQRLGAELARGKQAAVTAGQRRAEKVVRLHRRHGGGAVTIFIVSAVFPLPLQS